MNEQTKLFIEAIGAVGEMSGALRESLMSNGFTRKEAVTIVGIVIAETLSGNKSTEKE